MITPSMKSGDFDVRGFHVKSPDRKSVV